MPANDNRLVTFLLGAATGGLAALLLAPASGRETRRRLREASTDLYAQGLESAEDAKGRIEETAREVGDTAQEKARKVAGATRDRVEAAQEAVTEGKEAYHEELARRESPRRAHHSRARDDAEEDKTARSR